MTSKCRQSTFCRRTHLDDAADTTGHRAMKAVLEQGLRIPEDVAIIGCGNVLYASALRVPLSSVSQDSENMGEHAAKLVLEMVGAGAKAKPREVRMRPTLVARASTMGVSAHIR